MSPVTTKTKESRSSLIIAINDDSKVISDLLCSNREAILKTAKELVEDTKTLVAGAASSQEALASAAQNAIKTISKLADVVKLGATSIGADQPEAQVSMSLYSSVSLLCVVYLWTSHSIPC